MLQSRPPAQIVRGECGRLRKPVGFARRPPRTQAVSEAGGLSCGRESTNNQLARWPLARILRNLYVASGEAGRWSRIRPVSNGASAGTAAMRKIKIHG